MKKLFFVVFSLTINVDTFNKPPKNVPKKRKRTESDEKPCKKGYSRCKYCLDQILNENLNEHIRDKECKISSLESHLKKYPYPNRRKKNWLISQIAQELPDYNARLVDTNFII